MLPILYPLRPLRRRTLTGTMLDEMGLAIAMSKERREERRQRFGHSGIPLFAEACAFPGEALPDVDEAVADHPTNAAAVQTHVRKSIDRIVESTPPLVRRVVEAG